MRMVDKPAAFVATALLGLAFTLPVTAHAQNAVTSQFAASFSGFVFNRFTGTFDCILTLTNRGRTVYAPVAVQVNTNSGAVTVQNGNAIPNTTNVYNVPVPLPQGSLVPNETIQQRVAFRNPTQIQLAPTLAAITATGAPTGLALQVTSPPSGQQVSGPTFLVAGTVAGPSTTGVSINNVGACTIGHAFYLNSFRPASGTTNFSAMALDIDGGATSATVPYVANSKGITVQMIPDCGGLAPLNTRFIVSLESADGDSIQSLAIDFDGDGVVDQTLTAPIGPDGTLHIYDHAGLFRAQFTATTKQQATITQSVLVNVQTVATAFTSVLATLTLLQNAIAVGNIPRAASYFTPTSQQKYLALFNQMGASLPEAASALGTATLEALSGNFAQAVVTDGRSASYSVVLVRDSAGIWRVDSW